MSDDQPGLPFNARRRPMPDGDYPTRTVGPSFDTRAESILTHEAEGKVDSQAARILKALVSHGPMTRNELEKFFLYNQPSIRLSSICGRVRELMLEEEVECDGVKEDEDTGKSCEIIRAVNEFVITDEETVIS